MRPDNADSRGGRNTVAYGVDVDGSRFLMIDTADAEAQGDVSPHVVVVLNWFDESNDS